jgi:hypothetical protein
VRTTIQCRSFLTLTKAPGVGHPENLREILRFSAPARATSLSARVPRAHKRGCRGPWICRMTTIQCRSFPTLTKEPRVGHPENLREILRFSAPARATSISARVPRGHKARMPGTLDMLRMTTIQCHSFPTLTKEPRVGHPERQIAKRDLRSRWTLLTGESSTSLPAKRASCW